MQKLEKISSKISSISIGFVIELNAEEDNLNSSAINSVSKKIEMFLILFRALSAFFAESTCLLLTKNDDSLGSKLLILSVIFLASSMLSALKKNILSKQIATLPIYPDMKKKEIEYIIKTVSKWYRKNK